MRKEKFSAPVGCGCTRDVHVCNGLSEGCADDGDRAVTESAVQTRKRRAEVEKAEEGAETLTTKMARLERRPRGNGKSGVVSTGKYEASGARILLRPAAYCFYEYVCVVIFALGIYEPRS